MSIKTKSRRLIIATTIISFLLINGANTNAFDLVIPPNTPTYTYVEPTIGSVYVQGVHTINFEARILVDTFGISSTTITYWRHNSDADQTDATYNPNIAAFVISSSLSASAISEGTHTFKIRVKQVKQGQEFSHPDFLRNYVVDPSPSHGISLTPQQQALYGKNIHLEDAGQYGTFLVDLLIENSDFIALSVRDNTGTYHSLGTATTSHLIYTGTPNLYQYAVSLDTVITKDIPGYNNKRDFLKSAGVVFKFTNHYSFLGQSFEDSVEFWCRPLADKIDIVIELKRLFVGDDKEFGEGNNLEIYFKSYYWNNLGQRIYLGGSREDDKKLPINTIVFLPSYYSHISILTYDMQTLQVPFLRGDKFEIEVWDRDGFPSSDDRRMSLFIELHPTTRVLKDYETSRNTINDGNHRGFMWYTIQHYSNVNHHSYFEYITIKCIDAVPYGPL